MSTTARGEPGGPGLLGGDRARIDEALRAAVDRITGEGCAPGLALALRHAVLGRGRRGRPRLLLAVCRALRGEVTDLALAAAAALELVHCASLVHDDLPCFDDAPLRRGLPSVHRAHGQALAVLAGDALIVGAFEQLGLAGDGQPAEAVQLVVLLGRAAGAPAGLAAGQGWESEPAVELDRYHAAKTAALFELATMAGAVVAGAAPGPWRELGHRIGMTYQVADDVRDAEGRPEQVGKAVGRDDALGRPSAVRSRGLEACRQLLDRSERTVLEAVPDCRGRAGLVRFVSGLLSELLSQGSQLP